MADYRWVYFTSEYRVCDGCKRAERYAKTRHEYQDEKGRTEVKVSGTWVPLSKSKDVKHGDKCILAEQVTTKK